MALSILNSVSSLTAENALSSTQANLQKTLNRLSTGLKINSGSDDAAGLSIATGMSANIAALSQSQQNAANGIGMLQTADGALSQVSSLLNRAVTLATEAATTGITGSQFTALNNEFTSIKAEIDQIGNTTNFNGQNVFSTNTASTFSSGTSVTAATVLATGSKTTITDANTGGTFVFTASAGDTVATLTTAIATAVTANVLTAGTTGAVNAGTGKFDITTGGGNTSGITVSTDAVALGGMVAAAGAGNSATVFLGDGTSNVAGQTQIGTIIAALSSTILGIGGNSLSSSTNAQAALTKITTAINTVSSSRGDIGASVNRLTAASNNMSNTVTNLQSATNSIQNADIGKTVADMTQYNVLQSTGMSALQQSNQAQQALLKLVQ